jgi:hypothetical protein
MGFRKGGRQKEASTSSGRAVNTKLKRKALRIHHIPNDKLIVASVNSIEDIVALTSGAKSLLGQRRRVSCRGQRFLLTACLFCPLDILGEKYECGLRWILAHKEYFHHWKLRIYTDSTILKLDVSLIEALLSSLYIQIVLVCGKAEVRSEHLTVFRFLPFGEVSKHEIIVSVDLDHIPSAFILNEVSLFVVVQFCH